MSKKLIQYLFFLLLPYSFSITKTAAQSLNTDSLQKIIRSGNLNESNLIVYRQIASDFAQKGSYDSSIHYYRQGLEKSHIIKSEYWRVKYTLWLAGVFTASTKYDSAEHYLSKSFVILQKFENDSLLAQYHQNIGTLYMFQNRNEEAATSLIKGIEIMEKMKDKAPIIILMPAYMNLSGIFKNLNQPDKALVYERKAMAIKSAYQNTGDYASLYYNAATTYHLLNDTKNTKLYLDSALYFNKLYPNPRALLNIMGGLGTYYEKINNNDSAIYYLQQAIAISKESGDFYFFSEHAINAASVYFKQNKLAQANALLTEALPYAEGFSDFGMLTEIYKGMKEIAIKTGNYKDAVRFADSSAQYKDSTASLSTRNSVLSFEAKYQNEKKEKEIADLTLSNTQKELTVVKRNRLILIGGISAAALVLILASLYRNSHQKRLIADKDKLLKDEQIKFLERQQQVVSLQSMVNGQETERSRIAKDLHDGLGGLFSTIKMYFSTLQHEQDVLKNNSLFSKSYEMIDTASEEVRRIAHNMMPEVLMKLGLVAATQDMCSNISAGKLLKVKLQSYGMDERLNASTETMLYRIIQELLNNIIKHAYATEAIVQFNREDNRLTVTVEDNGRGFNTLESDSRNHAGLETIKNRVTYLNGNISIDSQQEVGTTVMMEFLLNTNA